METPRSVARSRPFERRVAPNIRERHTRTCTRSSGGSRCSCEPTYFARILADGESHNGSFAKLSDATAWVQDVRADGRDARRSGRDVPTLEIAARRFLRRALDGDALTHARRRYAKTTLESYERQLRLHVLEHHDTPTNRPLAALAVDEIDARVIQRLVDTTTTSVGSEAARVSAAALAALLRDLYVQGILDTLPPKILLPSPGPPRERVLTHDEYARLLDACRDDDDTHQRSLLYPVVALLGASGCRISEVVSLRWGPDGIDLDHDPPRLVVQRETTKTDAGRRTVTLDAEIAATLADHRTRTGAPSDGARAFARADGEPLTRSGVIRFGLERTSKLAGLASVTPHVLRHSHATWAASASVPTVALAARLGHTDPSFTLRRYTHATQHDLDQIPTQIQQHRDTHTTQHEGTPMPTTSTAGSINRPGVVEQYVDEVLSALQRTLDTAFPEFGWQRDAQGWHATNNEHTHARFGVRAERIVSHGDAPSGFLIHGHGPTLWTTYVNDNMPARGRDFIRAVEEIATRAGQPIELTRPPERQHRRDEILEATFDLARELFLDTNTGARARDHLIETRGFPADTISDQLLGVYPTHAQLRDRLRTLGFEGHEIDRTRVLSDSRWAGRLVGLWRDDYARPKTIWARALDADTTERRYLYLQGARRPITPYGLADVLALPAGERDNLVLVEGVLDLHHLRARGFTNVTALGGTGATRPLFERLAQRGIETVTLAFDGDTPGDRATTAAIDAAYQSASVPGISIVRLTDGDPDTLLRDHGAAAWADLLNRAEPAVPWRVERLLEAPTSGAAPTRTSVQRAGRWLGSLHPAHALDQDDGIRRIATIAGLDLDATRRALRERYWGQTIEHTA